jgi:AraC-like DNA-binding protein
MLSEYRQRFSEFHTCLHREDYLSRSGRQPRRDAARARSEYSDLFSPSVISELRAKLEATSQYLEMERTSLRRLIAFATEGALAARVREISAEIEGCESRAQIEGANELLLERLGKLREAALELGYESRLAMHCELRGVDGGKLAERAEQFLSRTESGYASAVSSLLAREAGVSIGEATEADLAFCAALARFDRFFPPERMLDVYRAIFAALGFDSEKQSNVEIDLTPRPNKASQAFCSPIRVPDEIKLAASPVGGPANYREFLREAGRAQHFAWTSRRLYPEFRIGGDRAVGEAWAMLFGDLALDEHWLLGTFGFAESGEFRRALASFKLMIARRQAALAVYESEFHAGRLASDAGARYAELMTGAARAQRDETGYLRALDDAFFSADYLRACAFDAQMREYLKTKFGERWWDSRKAGETLIDLWNTGQRYTAEELAAMIGLGELDFDWLASELSGQAEGRAR